MHDQNPIYGGAVPGCSDVQVSFTATREAGIAQRRAERDATVAQWHASAVARGKQWGQNVPYARLTRVAKLEDGLPDNLPDARVLANAIAGDTVDAREASDIMESTLGKPDPSDEELEGFIEGAAEAFAEV